MEGVQEGAAGEADKGEARPIIDFSDRTVKFYSIIIAMIAFCVSLAILGVNYMDNMVSMERFDNLTTQYSKLYGKCYEVSARCSAWGRTDYMYYVFNMTPTDSKAEICSIVCGEGNLSEYKPVTYADRMKKILG